MTSEERTERNRIVKRIERAIALRDRHRIRGNENEVRKLDNRIERMRATLRGYEE